VSGRPKSAPRRLPLEGKSLAALFESSRASGLARISGYFLASDSGRQQGRGKKACLLHANRGTKKFHKIRIVLLTTSKNRIEYGSCGEQACRLGHCLFTRFVGERKLFDKLTVKPMSSESAAVAVGDAPRDGI
jgi:hypothetical protein